MGVYGAVFGRRGDAGFSGPVLGSSRGVVGFSVAMFVRFVREIVRPARRSVGASAKKFALQAQNGRKTLLLGVLGEFFRGSAGGGAVLGEYYRETRRCAQVLSAARRTRLAAVGGFALHEAFRGCATGVSEPHVVQFPPFGGGKATTQNGVVPTVQTASSK